MIYQLNKELADNSTEIQSLIKTLKNKTIGVLVENFNEYPILEKINKSRSYCKKIIIPSELVIRESTAELNNN